MHKTKITHSFKTLKVLYLVLRVDESVIRFNFFSRDGTVHFPNYASLFDQKCNLSVPE